MHYRVTWPTKVVSKGALNLTPPPSVREPTNEVDTKGSDGSDDDTEDLLRHYLSLKLDLASLYEQWSEADPNFRKRAPKFEGVRMLSQDAWEALVSFICSSNNNISRISQMVRSCVRASYFGTNLLTRGGVRL